MTPFLYDNVNTGHHPGYLAGIVGAAEKSGSPFVVGSAAKPVTLVSNPWVEVDETAPRNIYASRRQLRSAARRACDLGAEVLVDLYLDKQVWTAGAVRADLPRSVHVLHHAEQYSSERRGLAAIRTAYLRQTLRSLTDRGAPVVVHTDRAAQLLEDLVPPELLVMAGYPVVPLPERRRHEPSPRVRLLFVGAGRHEKGLDLLFEALTAVADDTTTLRVVGRQPEQLRTSLTTRFPSAPVEWVDEYVDFETLLAEYQKADLAILPYRSTFSRHGGPSSVLLETLSAGLPVVTTTALAGQLPPGYDGALVADADSAEALAECLRTALPSLSDLLAAARSGGPSFIRSRHSFDTYFRHLRSAVEIAR
jgi:glycosyltransferase involved in cell wall biosynthesis